MWRHSYDAGVYPSGLEAISYFLLLFCLPCPNRIHPVDVFMALCCGWIRDRRNTNLIWWPDSLILSKAPSQNPSPCVTIPRVAELNEAIIKDRAQKWENAPGTKRTARRRRRTASLSRSEKKLLESLFVGNVSVFRFFFPSSAWNFVLKFVLLPITLKPSQATESADIRRASGR